MQTAFHTRLKRKKQPLAGKPAVAVSFFLFSLLRIPRHRFACLAPLAASQLLSVAGGHSARLEMKSQPLAGKPAGSAPLFQDAQNFNHISSERSRDLPCYQRCTTGIQYLHLLLPHHLLPWSEGR